MDSLHPDQITAAYQAVPAEQASADAKQQAKNSEENIRKAATSLSDYHQRCQTFIQSLESRRQQSRGPGSDDDNEIGHEVAPKLAIGPYTGAIYHRNGVTSSVYKAQIPPDRNIVVDHAPTHKLVALKVAELAATKPPHNIQREVRILKRVASAHIVPLLENFHDTNGRPVLVFPFMRFDLPALLSEGSRFTQAQRKTCLKSLFSALAYLHAHDVIHRDVKPSNILLGSLDGPAYLADFGITWDPSDPASEPGDAKITDVGTTCYRPPELLFGNTAYGTALDLWAAGCVVAEVVDDGIGTLFDAGDLGSDLTLISSIFRSLGTPTLETWPEAENFPDWGKFEFHKFATKPWDQLLSKASERERDLVSKLVKYESCDRETAAKVLDHPYFYYQ